MPDSQLIVCQHSHNWVIALRWVLSGSIVELIETRSLGECRHELAGAPASLLAVELTLENLEAIVELLVELPRSYPDARAVVLMSRDLAGCQWLMREAGALHVFVSERALGPMTELVARHTACKPRTRGNLRKRIWDDLPWD